MYYLWVNRTTFYCKIIGQKVVVYILMCGRVTEYDSYHVTSFVAGCLYLVRVLNLRSLVKHPFANLWMSNVSLYFITMGTCSWTIKLILLVSLRKFMLSFCIVWIVVIRYCMKAVASHLGFNCWSSVMMFTAMVNQILKSLGPGVTGLHFIQAVWSLVCTVIIRILYTVNDHQKRAVLDSIWSRVSLLHQQWKTNIDYNTR